ncbi:MAG: fasciclin domain-containing protein [Propionibacteriaceae bacterium]|nr:fasciclin domain-containing protein [Propionibacteriaceae bacterium]
MKLRTTLTKLAAVIFTGALATGLAVAPAQAAPGEQSLAAVLTADGNGTFDQNWYDYDIVTQAVLGVLAAKPDSNVKLLTDGSVALTAFIPNDRAFRLLAHDLTHKWYSTEKGVFDKLVAKLGIDAIENVLLYHVVPGGPILAKDALQADGAKLATGLPGASITVDVRGKNVPVIVLVDRDRNDANPRVNPWQTDINDGNQQVAHGITRVLRPINL